MPKEEWGVKRACPSCATRFYDLQKDPMICPACGHSFTLESLSNSRSRTVVSRKAPEKANVAKAPVADAAGDDDIVVEDANADIDLGDDVLEENEDDDTTDLKEIAVVPKDESDD